MLKRILLPVICGLIGGLLTAIIFGVNDTEVKTKIAANQQPQKVNSDTTPWAVIKRGSTDIYIYKVCGQGHCVWIAKEFGMSPSITK